MIIVDILMKNLNNLRGTAKTWKRRNKRFLTKARQNKDLDRIASTAHSKVFAMTNCLKCANCCKTTGPLFLPNDIDRLATHFRMTPGAFTERYLRTDEDGDVVLQEVPCPFLESDNHCSVYDIRPKACRKYPHTDDRHQRKIFNLTMKNAEICPAVLAILEEIVKEVGP